MIRMIMMMMVMLLLLMMIMMNITINPHCLPQMALANCEWCVFVMYFIAFNEVVVVVAWNHSLYV